jgi:SNF2 family DNA or RNA helicase
MVHGRAAQEENASAQDGAHGGAHHGTHHGTHHGAHNGAHGAAHAHVFAALQYLRRVCNHPLLALTPSHPLYERCVAAAVSSGGLTALACAPKLLALKQLLHECGIGRPAESGRECGTGLAGEGGGRRGGRKGGGEGEGGGALGDSGEGGSDNENGLGAALEVEEEGSAVTPLATHRALIFSQSGALLDLVESQVITLGLPSDYPQIAFGLPSDGPLITIGLPSDGPLITIGLPSGSL